MTHSHVTVGPQRYRERFGRYYEDFQVGDVYEHRYACPAGPSILSTT